MRLFLALPVPPSIAFPDSWGSPAEHITLHFLGEQEPGRLDALTEALLRSVQGIPPLSLQLRGLGAFPHPTNPRVLWIGVQEASGNLLRLHRRIAEEISAQGVDGERRGWVPHLTLRRVRQPKDRERVLEILQKAEDRTMAEFVVRNVHLYESRRTSSGGVLHLIRFTASFLCDPPETER